MKKILLCLFAAVSLIACTSNSDTKKEENVTITIDNVSTDLISIKDQIQTLEIFWDSAYNAGDLKTLMTIYSDDVIELRNNQMRTKGKIDAQKAMEASYVPGSVGHSKTTDVFGDGDIITEIGEGSNTDLKGKTSTNKYITVWKKQNGKYLIIAEMINSDEKAN